MKIKNQKRLNSCLGTKVAIKNIQLSWTNLLASLLLRQHNVMHFGNVMLSRHYFKLCNQLYTIWICLICLKWPVISVLVILKIPRLYNYNHNNTNRMNVLVGWILVWCAMWQTPGLENCAWKLGSARLEFFFTGLAWLGQIPDLQITNE